MWMYVNVNVCVCVCVCVYVLFDIAWNASQEEIVWVSVYREDEGRGSRGLGEDDDNQVMKTEQ